MTFADSTASPLASTSTSCNARCDNCQHVYSLLDGIWNMVQGIGISCHCDMELSGPRVLLGSGLQNPEPTRSVLVLENHKSGKMGNTGECWAYLHG